ncbi:hypothetical protein F7725_009277 [Dissostichus mawsoni]|uniref:Uncharacterized protein n=1 Tax=Dissostichus mawsoni TaxID=36200 RepID=A0A7J5ZAP2_DISMA|nr:hypothetical protein F7725_009277 [Dissostichus mawsoni]
MVCESHLFGLLGTLPDVTGGGAVLSQAVHRLAVHQLDGAHQTGAGAAVVLVAAGVAEVYVGADEALLVAQQDHNLCRQNGGVGELVGGVGLQRVAAAVERIVAVLVVKDTCEADLPLVALASEVRVQT